MEALDLPGLKLACCAECAHLDRRGDETRHLTTHVWISRTQPLHRHNYQAFSFSQPCLAWTGSSFEVIMMLSATR